MKRHKLLVALFCALLGLLIIFSTFGCNKSSKKSDTEKTEQKEKEQTTESTDEQATDKRKVLMMGRSVMESWFVHWNSSSDFSKPVQHNGFAFYYKTLEVPPDIVDSVKGYLDEDEDANSIIFFKLCFDDFQGSSKSEAKANLTRNKKYVQEVYDLVVKEHGLKLIIGNALPKVKDATDSQLVWNEQSYNSWLQQFAQEHPDEVHIFDQYGILADSDGNLKKEYAVDEYDSHPNDKAYSALDNAFYDLLQKNFSN